MSTVHQTALDQLGLEGKLNSYEVNLPIPSRGRGSWKADSSPGNDNENAPDEFTGWLCVLCSVYLPITTFSLMSFIFRQNDGNNLCMLFSRHTNI